VEEHGPVQAPRRVHHGGKRVFRGLVNAGPVEGNLAYSAGPGRKAPSGLVRRFFGKNVEGAKGREPVRMPGRAFQDIVVVPREIVPVPPGKTKQDASFNAGIVHGGKQGLAPGKARRFFGIKKVEGRLAGKVFLPAGTDFIGENMGVKVYNQGFSPFSGGWVKSSLCKAREVSGA
jgi:hypothetical protein